MLEEIWFGLALVMMWGTTMILYIDNRKRISAHDRELTVLAMAIGNEIAEGENECQ